MSGTKCIIKGETETPDKPDVKPITPPPIKIFYVCTNLLIMFFQKVKVKVINVFKPLIYGVLHLSRGYETFIGG